MTPAISATVRVYTRSYGEIGHVVTKLLCGKSRVALIKAVTISQLEFCGALLLARLYREASEAFGIRPSSFVMRFDDNITLDKNVITRA